MADEPDLLIDNPNPNDEEWVRYLKQTLEYWGFWSGDHDGPFDETVEEAVRRFQDAQRLVVDGWVGPRTWMVLNREGAVIDLDEFPVFSRLAQLQGEQEISNSYAQLLEVDDLADFSERVGDTSLA